ncbi:hypothetical protein [Amycolatopsis sp. NPDC004378]
MISEKISEVDTEGLEFQMPYAPPLAPELLVFNDAGASTEVRAESSRTSSASIPTIMIFRDETAVLHRG